jgi:hypothetical protein
MLGQVLRGFPGLYQQEEFRLSFRVVYGETFAAWFCGRKPSLLFQQARYFCDMLRFLDSQNHVVEYHVNSGIILN